MTAAERFWSRVSPEPTTGCWLWTGGANGRGYGQVWFANRQQSVHRVAFVLANGPIPQDRIVMHRCDNRPCVNPGHLVLGSHQENTDDMRRKGRERHVQGSEHPFAKTTEQDILEVRELYAKGWTATELAKMCSRKVSWVCSVVSRRAWKHV